MDETAHGSLHHLGPIFTVVSIIGLGALLTALEVSRWSHRSVAEVNGFDPLLHSFAGINLAQLAIGVIGVLIMTSEYATRSIKLTFGATPQRRLLLVLCCYAAFTLGAAFYTLVRRNA